MSKTKRILDVVSDLRSLAESIQAVCEAMNSAEETSSEAKPPEHKTPPAEPPKVTVTIEQIRSVLAKKSQEGKTAKVRDLLLKFGASRLSEIASEVYEDLLKEAEEI